MPRRLEHTPNTRHHRSHRLRGFATVALVTLVMLAGCGSSSSKSANPTVEPTAGPVPTLAADQVSVGSLIDRIDAAWPSVRNTREVSWSGSSSGTIGTPRPDQTVTTEDTVLPSSRRVVVTTGGIPSDDQIAIQGVVFFKGAFVVGAVAPFAGADTWVRVDPSIVPADSIVGQRLAYLTGPIEPPYDTVTDDLRARAASPAGQIMVGGRPCNAFTFVDTTANGSKIDYALSLDDTNLPCSLVQSAGSYENFTIYEFNNPNIRITAPETATLVSATPEG